MTARRRFQQLCSLEAQLAQRAAELRELAETLPPGIERDTILRKARQAEAGSHMSEWLRSPGF
jgi:hypothetical protein